MQQLSADPIQKVRELEQLADLVAASKAAGKRVVHCHGVFDLLHVGHLRHFEAAKKLGDVLVVTITPDRFVNKGPHRPAFTEALRAEALAALSCVDYVAINRWPTATELIRMLRPSCYVKGSDYKDAADDVTGGIEFERQAIESVGGELVFTDDITFSSTTLINKNLSVFTKEVSDYLTDFSTRYSCDDIRKYVDELQNLRVLVVGEAIIDEYAYCEAIGKSGKEPMLAIKQLSEERFAGGILAVANNISQFCGSVGLVTLIGDDGVHDEFVKQSLNDKIKPHLLRRRNSPTIVKKRFIESYFFSKLMAVYTINDSPLSQEDNVDLCDRLSEVISDYDVVIVVDFGHSMLTQRAANIICSQSKYLAVNTQSNAGNLGYQTIFKYSRADYVCITENEMRLEVRDKVSDPKHIIPKLAYELSANRVCITQGKRGSMGYDQKEGFIQAPALASQVVDRMGAGDAFLAITSLCAATGAPMEVVQFIGNAVGAQAVATVGHREPIGRAPLLKYVASLLK